MVFAAVGLALLLLAIYGCCILPTQWLKVERVRLPLSLGVKILQISDLHIERMRIRPERFASLIRRERPDLICLTGDLVDRRLDREKLDRHLAAISGHGAPVFAVFGNHDYSADAVEALRDMLGDRGIRALHNECVDMGRFVLVGIDDYCTGLADPAALGDAAPDQQVVVVTHDPTVAWFMDRPFSYLMGGHFHGGQFGIPFIFRIMDFGPMARSGVYHGLHRHANGTFYISKGVGQSGINCRFLVRSEVTVHEL